MDDDTELELYKIVVETISQNESKRLQANSTYLGIIVAIATVSASVKNINFDVILLLSLLVATIWYFTIKFHRDLAKAKFSVLKKFEEKMSIKPFADEWKYYKSHKFKLTLTQIEIAVPIVVGMISIGWLIIRLFT